MITEPAFHHRETINKRAYHKSDAMSLTEKGSGGTGPKAQVHARSTNNPTLGFQGS